jgi:hypothetical protein
VAPRDARGCDHLTTTLVEANASSAQAAGVVKAPAVLSWTAFGERYFPGRRRHLSRADRFRQVRGR